MPTTPPYPYSHPPAVAAQRYLDPTALTTNKKKHGTAQKQRRSQQNHISYLIHCYNVPKSTKVSGAYGKAEVQLILEDIFKQILGGGGTKGT